MQVTRNFTVRGQVRGLFTPEGGTPQPNYVANMNVELWHKGIMGVVFLGSSLTAEDGEFNIVFTVDSPSVIIENGKINEVFLKVSYQGELLIGEVDVTGDSFD